MNAKMALPSPLFPPPTSTHNTPHKSPSLFLAPRRRRRPLVILRATGPATANDDNKEEEEEEEQQQPPITVDDTNNGTTKSPRTTLTVKYRARSRNQAKKRKAAAAAAPSPPPKKEWDAMTLGEKAVELYVGEKGLLFWLNKFAYASIFAVIGGWILFRFVGPSLGLYQLDSAPLSPSSIFKGSP
uniref:Uncharacterized protein n=1 Tax=Puya raimondii TaxID=112807 RepID=A0A8A0WGY9_PUYRA|nr:hypothetical protein PY_020791 [Puya raimondii]